MQITSEWMFLKYMNYWKVVWSFENCKQVLNKLKTENSSILEIAAGGVL